MPTIWKTFKFLTQFLKDFIKNGNFSFFLEKYLLYLNKKQINRGNLIFSIKNYFANELSEINYQNITPKITINLSNEEKEMIQDYEVLKKLYPEPHYQNEVFTCQLKNVKFSGISGGIIYKNKIIVESLRELIRLKQVSVVDSVLLKHKNKKGTFTSIMFLPWSYINIYHWNIECVPRLYALTKIKEKNIKLIINDDIKPYQLEMMKIILKDQFDFVKIKKNEIWTLENYIFSSFVYSNLSGYLTKDYYDFIKTKILEGYNIKPPTRKIRLYISRARMAKRSVKNENALLDILSKYNFQRICPELLSYKEQIKLFYSAEIIVGPTGAALTNIIFSENSKLLSFYPEKGFGINFIMICKSLGIPNDHIICKEQDINTLNFIVDIIEFDNF